MEHAFVQSLSDLGGNKVLLLTLVGVFIGLFTGLLPGLGVIVVLTLLLPFVYHMTPFEAFGLLLGVYSVFTITGDITSILLGIPAHPECAAMVLDGYPMTKQGKSSHALGAAISSAALGAVIGAAVLFFSVPILRPLVIHLGAPDLFALILLGLAMIGTLSGQSVLKGIIGAAFGILLATVGTNDQTGIIRYGFGSLYLVDGIALVPFAIGLFAIPEIMNMYARGRSGASDLPPSIGSGRLEGVRDTLSHPGLVLRGSLIGALPAMLPGLGGGVGQWAAYGQAAQISKTPEKFGTGCIEGVIAPGAANNSKEGGQLVPTIAFGIPGGPAMAVLLGAFTLLGLQPGPAMLSANLNVTYFMIWVLVIANLVGSALCFLLLKPLSRIAFVPSTILMPLITCLVIVGAASDTTQWPTLAILLITGIVAFALRQTGWSVAPIILGFVLGKSGENYLWQSYQVYGLSWLRWPVVDVILALAALMIASIVRRRSKARRNPAANSNTSSSAGRNLMSTFRGGSLSAVVVSSVITAVGIAATAIAYTWPTDAAVLPMAAGATMTLLGMIETYQELRLYRRRDKTDSIAISELSAVSASSLLVGDSHPASSVPVGVHDLTVGITLEDSLAYGTGGVVTLGANDSPTNSGVSTTLSTKKCLVGFAWMVATTLLSYVLGFFLALPLFVLTYMLVLRKPWWKASIAAVTAGGLFWVVFVHFLNVQLPFPMIGPTWV